MDSYLKYLSENSTELILYAQQHFLLVLYSVALATVFSLVLALVLHTNQLTPPSWRHTLRVGSRETSLLLASAALTIPSLALFGLLQPLLGLGVTPSIVAPGFGRPLQDGLARLGAVNSFNEVISGTLGCLVVAAGYEIIFAVVRRITTPRGIRV